MRVTPVAPVVPRNNKAGMIIHHEQHIVYNYATGDKIELPAKEAWALHESLNMVDIVV